MLLRRVVIGAMVCCLISTLAAAQMQGFGEPSYRRAGPAAFDLSPEDIVALPGTKWMIAGALPKTDASARGACR
jgi:hypothetical protein